MKNFKQFLAEGHVYDTHGQVKTPWWKELESHPDYKKYSPTTNIGYGMSEHPQTWQKAHVFHGVDLSFLSPMMKQAHSGGIHIRTKKNEHQFIPSQHLVDANNFRIKQMQANIKKPGYKTFGWKLHLNVPQEKHEMLSAYLTKAGVPHKYQAGTGKDDEGKDFTVYTGSKHDTHSVAHGITKHLSHLVSPNHSSVVDSGNKVITPHTSARFSIGYNDHRFAHTTGSHGIELLADDDHHLIIPADGFGINPSLHKKIKPENRAKMYDALHRAHKELSATYGDFYHGDPKVNYGW